jgi:hypothetical protein
MTSPQPDFDPMDTSNYFTHPPLNLQTASIRLIRLHATSDSNEAIDCDMIVTTPDDQYTCLSYVWGDDTSGQWILVNGQRFWVRQNLWNFLNQARQDDKLNPRQFWIDALCIDQENIAERQHQVQQMGTIYGKATEVISWLGLDKDIVKFLRVIQDSRITENMSFYRSPYWNRAWITQEIVLGHNVWLMAHKYMFPLDDLLSKSNFYSRRGPHFSRSLWGRLNYIKVLREAPLSKKALPQMLIRFKSQQCQLRRDRIFSLLALCGLDTTINVDYKSADIDVAIDVFKCCRKSFCLCFINLVTATLATPSPPIDESYPFGAGHLAAFCAVTLPIVAAHTASINDMSFIASSCATGSHSVCGDRRSGEVEVFQYKTKPERTRVRIRLNLSRLCSTYCGWVAVWIDSEKEGFSYRYFGSCGGGRLATTSSGTGDVGTQILRIGHHYKVMLPIGFWIQLSTIAERHDNRGAGEVVELASFCSRVHRGKSRIRQGLELRLDVCGTSIDTETKS